jgi:hypothetical protein
MVEIETKISYILYPYETKTFHNKIRCLENGR